MKKNKNLINCDNCIKQGSSLAFGSVTPTGDIQIKKPFNTYYTISGTFSLQCNQCGATIYEKK